VCPMCQRADRIQRVKSIIDSGSTTSTIYGTDNVIARGYTEDTTKLAKRLQKPFYRIARPVDKSGCTILPGILVLGFGGMALFGAFFFCVGGALTASGSPAKASQGYQGILIGIVALIIGGAITYGAIRMIQNASTRNQANDPKHQSAVSDYQQELARVKLAESRWEHELYYCFRDDCVFIPGQTIAVSPEQMNQILFS